MKRALVRTAFSPVIYEVLDFAVAIYDRDIAPARAGAEPADLHGHDELLRRGRRRRRRRRGRARAGRHHPLQRPLRHRLAPAGRRRGDAGLPRDDELSATRRSRRTGSTSAARSRTRPTPSTSSRRARSSRASSSTRAASSSRTSTAWRSPTRACRRWSPATSTPRSSACAPARRRSRGSSSATASSASASAVERMFDHGEAVVRRYFEQLPDGRYVGHGEMDNERRRRRSGAVRGRRRDRRLDRPARLLERARRSRPGRSTARCRRPSRRAGSRSRCSPAAARRRTRATSARSRSSRGRARCSTRCPRRRASSTAGRRPGDRGRSTRRSRDAMPEAVPACSGGDICALVWWGEREETGEPWTDGSPHPVGQGAHAGGDGANSLMHVSEAATRFTPIEVWEAKNPWLLEQVELAPDSGGPGRHRGGLGVDIDFTMREDAYADVDRRAHEERAVGARRRWRGAREQRRRCELPDGTRHALRQGHAPARAARGDRAAAHRRRRRLRRPGRARRRRRCTRTSARATSARSTRAATTRTRSRTAVDGRPPDRRRRRARARARLRDPRHGRRRRGLHGVARHARGPARARPGGRRRRCRSSTPRGCCCRSA